MEEDSINDREFSEPSSEFGKGLTYCLGLFLAHAERANEMEQQHRTAKAKGIDLFATWPESWFNGASDHLYDLETEVKDEAIKIRLVALKDKALTWGHGFRSDKKQPTFEDVMWAIKETKDLLREIDSKLLGVKTEQGTHE